MIKYKKETIEQDVIDDILCDLCQNTTRKSYNFEYAKIISDWGYESKKDREVWNYILCEDCADKLIDF